MKLHQVVEEKLTEQDKLMLALVNSQTPVVISGN